MVKQCTDSTGIHLAFENMQKHQVEQVLSFNILMSFGTFMHISYVALITHYNSNMHFIFNYNAYKDLVWTVNYYNQHGHSDYELNLLTFTPAFSFCNFQFYLGDYPRCLIKQIFVSINGKCQKSSIFFFAFCQFSLNFIFQFSQPVSLLDKLISKH